MWPSVPIRDYDQRPEKRDDTRLFRRSSDDGRQRRKPWGQAPKPPAQTTKKGLCCALRACRCAICCANIRPVVCAGGRSRLADSAHFKQRVNAALPQGRTKGIHGERLRPKEMFGFHVGCAPIPPCLRPPQAGPPAACRKAGFCGPAHRRSERSESPDGRHTTV